MKILFIGNSHTYFHDLPQVFAGLAESGGFSVQADMIAYPGVTFGWHLRQESQLRYALLYGNYDYVILSYGTLNMDPGSFNFYTDQE